MRLVDFAFLPFLALPAHAAINTLNLGANYDAAQVNVTFRVYSSRATQIEVDLYAVPMGASEVLRFTLTADSSTGIFSTSIPVATLRAAGITGPVYYGYRAWGPNWPFAAAWVKGAADGFLADVDKQGNRFNPNKLLMDPYAREISHDPHNASWTDGSVYASGAAYRNKDSGNSAPKSILWIPAGQSIGTKPLRAQKDDLIYEVNLRGLTKNDPSVPAALQGTYAGAALKAASLANLGITAIEFQPVQETQNDANDNNVPPSTSGQNYWGYATLNYFAPDRRYASNKAVGGPTSEFQAMVKAFHDQGLKVYIDVVYNHTGEGGPWNPSDSTVYNILSWRGLDNPSYYVLTADGQFTWDDTGSGDYNTYNPVAQNLIVDSLAYWRDTMGVDGFRFDLAPVLGDTCTSGCFNFNASDPHIALNRITAELTTRPGGGGAGVDLYAEPWTTNGVFQGQFPAGWSEWNGSFRDTLRRAQNELGQTTITTGPLATRFAGSSDLFAGRNPWNSTNFMVVHDGLTLKDVYSCNGSNNSQAWPYGPSDGGATSNDSWDQNLSQGAPAADQRAAARVGFAFIALSAGTPLMLGGDEHLRSLQCNNNAYDVDSIANWLGYAPTGDQSNFAAYVQGLIAFRNAHPALRPAGFYSPTQLQWWTPAGATPDGSYFNSATNHAIAWQWNGAALGDAAPSIYVAYNAWSDNVEFTLPSPSGGTNWYRVTDTCGWAEGPGQVRLPGAEDLIGPQDSVYGLCGRGLLLLIAK